MELLSKLSPKMKILILVIYTTVIASIALVVFQTTKPSIAEDYKDYVEQASDDNVSMAVRLRETRTAADISKQTNKERASWDVRLYLAKKDQLSQIKNVRGFVTAVTQSDKIVFKERIMADFPNKNLTVLIGEIGKKTNEYSDATKEYTKTNQEPSVLYVKLIYDIKNSDNEFVTNTINYKLNLVQTEEIKFEDFTERALITETGGKKDYFINEGELFNIIVEAGLDTNRSESNKTNKDNFRFKVVSEGANQIKNLKLVVYAKAENDPSDTENYFDDYIKMEQIYGDLNDKTVIDSITLSYSTTYNISKLFVFGITTDTTCKTSTTSFWANVNKLKKY